MKRRLSSLEALVTKWLVPLVFGGASIFILIQFIPQWHQIKDLSHVWFPLLWVAGALTGCWYSFLLKDVSVDDGFLYVKNYFKEVAIPLSHIERVTYFGLGNIRQGTVHLKSPSKFGKKIRSASPHHSFFGVDELPVVEELRKLAREHNERAAVSTKPTPNKSLKPTAR